MKHQPSFLAAVLPKGRFARAVSVLVGGTAGAQCLQIVAAPVLTRLYHPDDFGLLAVFTALLSTLSIVASLRYELAIPLQESDRRAAALLMLSVAAGIVVTLVSIVPILIWHKDIAELLHMPALADYLWLLPLGVLLASLYNALSFWAVRKQAFTPVAKTRLSQAMITVGLQLAGTPLGPVALLAGQVAGHGAGILSLVGRAVLPYHQAFREISLRDLRQVASRYRRFPLFSTWGALFNTAGMHLPPILFSYFFSPAAAGLYLLANRVLSLPMQLLGQAIANVFISGAAKQYRDGQLGAAATRLHAHLSHIGMPPAILLMFSGADIFTWLFGPAWREAGVFAQWMAPWLYLVFVTSPITSLTDVLERQAAGMAYQALLLAVRILAIVVGAHFGGARLAVGLFALGSASCWLGNLVWLIRASGNGWGAIWQPMLSAFVWAMALVSPLILTALLWQSNSFLSFMAMSVASILIVIRYAYLMKRAFP